MCDRDEIVMDFLLMEEYIKKKKGLSKNLKKIFY
jgi:hypothetical protein